MISLASRCKKHHRVNKTVNLRNFGVQKQSEKTGRNFNGFGLRKNSGSEKKSRKKLGVFQTKIWFNSIFIPNSCPSLNGVKLRFYWKTGLKCMPPSIVKPFCRPTAKSIIFQCVFDFCIPKNFFLVWTIPQVLVQKYYFGMNNSTFFS